MLANVGARGPSIIYNVECAEYKKKKKNDDKKYKKKKKARKIKSKSKKIKENACNACEIPLVRF